jgi:hypothetical protein
MLTACGSASSAGTASDSQAKYIENKGSDTIVNLALAWAEKYQGEHPDVRISVTGGGSGTGLAALINKTVDIANASRKIKAEEIDEIESVAVRISIFQIKKPTKLARQLGSLIYRCAKEVNAVFPSLRNRRNLENIRSHIVRINDLEHEADQIFWMGLREVSDKRDDVIHFVIWKEIYERLESVTDRMEDIGDVLQRVLIKNA